MFDALLLWFIAACWFGFGVALYREWGIVSPREVSPVGLSICVGTTEIPPCWPLRLLWPRSRRVLSVRLLLPVAIVYRRRWQSLASSCQQWRGIGVIWWSFEIGAYLPLDCASWATTRPLRTRWTEIRDARRVTV